MAGRGKNLIVGLTGGMGCGKSTAAGMFEARGFVRVDSDRLIREEILTQPAVIAALRERFGPDVVDAGGAVRRDEVAKRVFTDDAALAWLEGLVHPRLHEFWRERFTTPDGRPVLAEVPLLFEKRLENWFDFTVCVTTDSATQLRRLEQRGVPPELARQRLVKQMPLARKCELADHVLLNDGSPDFLREQVNALADRLLNQ